MNTSYKEDNYDTNFFKNSSLIPLSYINNNKEPLHEKKAVQSSNTNNKLSLKEFSAKPNSKIEGFETIFIQKENSKEEIIFSSEDELGYNSIFTATMFNVPNHLPLPPIPELSEYKVQALNSQTTTHTDHSESENF